MKRFFWFLILGILTVLPAHAVLKERDLARTLGVLRAELQLTHEKQQAFLQMYEQQGIQQHQQLVSYMTQCEQIGLMLYSQSTENTFDMAYACQQATNLWRELHYNATGGKQLPYDRVIATLKLELERYDALITALKSMPPVDRADADSVLTQSDSILLGAIDSLQHRIDILAQQVDTTQLEETIALMPKTEAQEEKGKEEPLFLTGQLHEDREQCLQYAQTIRGHLQEFLTQLEAESSYYKSVQEKVEALHQYAQRRYRVLQDNIFKNGSTNYFSILAHLPQYILRAVQAIDTKYRPFDGHSKDYSEWRGMYVLSISVFVVFYLFLALGLTYVVLRWLLPKSWRGEDYKLKRTMLTNVVGIAVFALIVMGIRYLMDDRNFVQMSTGLIINMAWLLEIIFLSLYIRLQGDQMRHAAFLYTPLMLMSFIVILFRIILIPNMLVNLVYPPILLGFAIWQICLASKHSATLPLQDRIYTSITTIVMVLACVASWSGFTLLAVQIMIWWTFQLAAIMTITCLYHLMELFEERVLVYRIQPKLKKLDMQKAHSRQERNAVLRRMEHGDFITQTWFYDLFNRTLVPICAVSSVLVSIYWASGIFEMTDICQRAFFTNFIDEKDLIQLSLAKLCLVAALWFVFRYINYAIRSIYAHFRKQMVEDKSQYNSTLAQNVIAIVCWGLYFITALVILHVPKSGISIVTAGLATGVGFAMQSIIENFFYGLSLMTGRLRVGDYIECDGITGKVESITYQSTQIITADGCVIAFMNSALFSKNFKNMTRNHRYELIKIPVGVAYGTDVEEVRRCIIEAVTPLCQAKNENGTPVANPNIPVTVSFADFGASSVDLKVNIWMRVEDKIALTARVREAIYNTLNEHNIEIPFPQTDVHMR
ncbi:MAG: mechanosensitive ion channel [Bacteroidaceae bacterium]|nr:mechanosensitive ion channel [Bacteroidaceae bacterium]